MIERWKLFYKIEMCEGCQGLSSDWTICFSSPELYLSMLVHCFNNIGSRGKFILSKCILRTRLKTLSEKRCS